MNLLLTGLNHKSAPISVREKISFDPANLPKAFELFRGLPEIRESLILSTCNRTEIYVVTQASELNGLIPECLGRFHELPTQAFLNHLYTKEGTDVARHLFTVTAGLDSLVLGEGQILNQVRRFYRYAQEAGNVGTVLHRLCSHALEAGKRIRRETTLGENPRSIGEAALDLARQIFGSLEGKGVLILGGGKMGRALVDALARSRQSKIMVAARNFEKGKTMAHELGAVAYPLEQIELPLLEANIVITATGSPTPLLTKAFLQKMMKERREAPLFIIDIAVPRDVDANAGELENLFLYNIDDLQEIVKQGNETVEKEMTKANRILEEELSKFIAWKESLQIIPTLRALTRKIEAVKADEIRKALAKFSKLGQRERKIVENLAHSLIGKIMHRPLVQLKTYRGGSLGKDYLEVARDLFGLGEDDDA